ncbi:hypothetical protein GOBAR_DD33073 [Gossypium barbadense]|nr:hypothetical protein GOBAR_DD33073 [Gossypium barbadense]
MIEDIVLYIKKLADVIDYPFSYEEIEKRSVDKIANMCSFENLSNLEVDKSSKHREGTSRVMENKIYFLKASSTTSHVSENKL